MGPIEKELRAYPKDNVSHWTDAAAGGGLSWEAFHVLSSAAASLLGESRDTYSVEDRMPEVLSEAIEAAEALGI